MQHHKPIAFLTVAFHVLVGCAGPDSPPAETTLAVQDTVNTTVVEPRWQANTATIEAIRGMRALVEAFPAHGIRGAALRDSLDERMATIFERCTMEGEAHMALHDYLVPLMSLIKKVPVTPLSTDLDSIRLHLQRFEALFR